MKLSLHYAFLAVLIFGIAIFFYHNRVLILEKISNDKKVQGVILQGVIIAFVIALGCVIYVVCGGTW
jgi:hypothetical protein